MELVGESSRTPAHAASRKTCAYMRQDPPSFMTAFS